jgi:hypothetical protein
VSGQGQPNRCRGAATDELPSIQHSLDAFEGAFYDALFGVYVDIGGVPR